MYLPNDEHEVLFSTCMAQIGYGQSAYRSDSMTSTHIVRSYPPPPRKTHRDNPEMLLLTMPLTIGMLTAMIH